jgi:hypothetical protein
MHDAVNPDGVATPADRADPPSPKRRLVSARFWSPAMASGDVHRRPGAVTVLSVVWVVACLALYVSQLVRIAGG